MTDLLVRPSASTGKVHDITPQTAGWGYVGFGHYRLRAGDKVAGPTGAREVILVLVEGKAELTAGEQDFGEMGARMNVFEKTQKWCCFPSI